MIHEPPLSVCVGNDLLFLQFDNQGKGDKEKIERMIGWAHPQLIDKLSLKTSHFWDGTFHVCINFHSHRPFKR